MFFSLHDEEQKSAVPRATDFATLSTGLSGTLVIQINLLVRNRARELALQFPGFMQNPAKTHWVKRPRGGKLLQLIGVITHPGQEFEPGRYILFLLSQDRAGMALQTGPVHQDVIEQ